jgi:hypothetical protein
LTASRLRWSTTGRALLERRRPCVRTLCRRCCRT